MFFLWALVAVVGAVILVGGHGLYLVASGKDYILRSHYEKTKDGCLYVFFQIEVGRMFRKSTQRTAFMKCHKNFCWRENFVKGLDIPKIKWVEDGRAVASSCYNNIKWSLQDEDRKLVAVEALDVMIDGLDTDSVLEKLKQANKEIERLKRQIPYDDGMRQVRVGGRWISEDLVQDLLDEKGLLTR